MASEMTSSSFSVARFNIARATVATALATGILFAACWVGAVIKVSAAHMFVALFTSQPIDSLAALSNGLVSSVVFGALFGLAVSAVYNVLPFGRG
jgi:hypothetical protein